MRPPRAAAATRRLSQLIGREAVNSRAEVTPPRGRGARPGVGRVLDGPGVTVTAAAAALSARGALFLSGTPESVSTSAI
ncbi:hypothetical protein NDU88_000703 [Pleurodeles waltl]|uniref:Uncharacterized protein n=1 Tax=Pleurodeles waltl TaxID=8319 RepID=A0AAV7L7E9_PLEWA|nr:hypothetical protein NDU88_000703 [Pleurodeles waltl]